MKHSASGPMSESCEANVPCESEPVLEKLSIDLCNLIVESRLPGFNERGYGVHCPPLLGSSKHTCDLSKPECQKHQMIMQHVIEAIESSIFEIEVLLLPECCEESKLQERIQSKEYILIERWTMNFIHGKVESKIEISQLLRAVRSFLHFSQISAWLSSSNGKSPANIFYWVNPKLEAMCTKFKHEPEVHSFPFCRINEDLYGSVKVEFPARTQYIPIIPCSKHPPLCRYSLRAINESDLCQNISPNSQIVRQLHKTCDSEQTELTAINFVPEPTALMLAPTSFLKTFSAVIPNESKANRVLKHSNLQDNLLNSANLSLDIKNKTIDIIPKMPSTFVYNCAETISLGVCQGNLCCNKKKLARHLCKTELKLKKIKKDVSAPLTSESSAPILPPEMFKLNQNMQKHSVKIDDMSLVSNLLNDNSCKNSLRSLIESSPVNFKKNSLSCSQNLNKQLAKQTKAFKRKDCDLNGKETYVLPNKKMCCDKNFSLQIFKSPSTYNCEISMPQCSKTSRNKEIITLSKTLHKGFQENSATLALSSKNSDIKLFEVKHQHCSSYLFPSQSATGNIRSPTQCYDFENSINSQNSTKLFKSPLLGKILQKSKSNVSRLNTAIKLPKRKCTQLDSETNVRSKLLDEGNQLLNWHGDSTCTVSRTYFSDTKQTKYLDSRSSDKKVPLSIAIPKSNCYGENNSHMKGNRIYSMNYLETSFQSRPLQLKEKTIQKQESNLRKSYRLFLASEQIPNKNNIRETVITDTVTGLNIEQDLKSSSVPKKKIEKSSATEPKKRLLKRSLFENISVNKKSVLKSRRKGNLDEKTLHPTLQPKLDRLFRVKKTLNQNNNCKRKNIKSTTYLEVKFKSNSSQTLYENSRTLSANDCQNDIVSTNLCMKTKAKAFFTNANYKSESQGTTLSAKEVAEAYTKNDNYSTYQFHSSLNPLKVISLQTDHQSSFVLNSPVSTASRNVCQIMDENLECFPKCRAKFPKGRKLLINFEESILKGCLPMVNNVKGFHAEIGASGSFCPNHLTLPADVSFYELGHPNQGTTPYVAHVSLKNSEYCLPKKGAVQVTLFNPSETVVKMFVLNYDLSSMPPLCHTFIRQKTYYLPIGLNKEHPASQKWLRFIIHLRFASSKTGRISLHEDLKIVVLNKTNDDAASEFSQEPRELYSFLSVPMNPTFSTI